jgi:pimeloyl-ACP methyl ester carboxylesterase
VTDQPHDLKPAETDLPLDAAGHRLAARWHGSAGDQAPTLVFLHEGLGSIAQWKDFPAVLADATGCGALIYDRYGYGGSDRLEPPYERDVDFMQVEAREVLPALLDQTGVRQAILIGHSDGGSIALLAAASLDTRIRGVVTEAAHVFVEPESVASIEDAVIAFRAGDLRDKLARYHGEAVDSAFYGWANTWLNPDFEAFHIEGYLRAITCPVLAIQGIDDAYGTPAQLDMIKAAVSGPVETMLLAACGHAPHVDLRDDVLAAMAEFIRAVLLPADGAPPIASNDP